jgi:hypothetical protein
VAGRRSRSRAGISALVATIILIALTVLGGVMIWAYFQRTAGGLMAAGEKLDVQAVPQMAGTWKIVDFKATNLHSVPVRIDTINVIYPNRDGIPIKVTLTTSPAPVGQIMTAPALPFTLNPNQYVGATLRVVVNATTLEILYTPTGQAFQQRRSRSRAGISALVATIILIALTVLGGVLIWAYFQRTTGGLMAAGEKLDVQAVPQVAGTWKIVDFKATNLHSVPVTLNAINVIYPNRDGIPTKATLTTSSAPAGQIMTAPTLPFTLNPNQYVGATLRVVVNATTLEILYTPTGQPQQTVLVSIG